MDGLHRDLIREKVNGSVCVCVREGEVYARGASIAEGRHTSS